VVVVAAAGLDAVVAVVVVVVAVAGLEAVVGAFGAAVGLWATATAVKARRLTVVNRIVGLMVGRSW